MKNKVTAFTPYTLLYNHIPRSHSVFWFEGSWSTNCLFGCAPNKLLLRPTCVIHWFYWCYFWTFVISWRGMWDPGTAPGDSGRWANGRSTRRAAFSLALDSRGQYHWDPSSALFAFRALGLHCADLYCVCKHSLMRHTLLFKRGQGACDSLCFGATDGKDVPPQLRFFRESKGKDSLHLVYGPGSRPFQEKRMNFRNCRGHFGET